MHRRAEREGKITITTYVKVHIFQFFKTHNHACLGQTY